MKGITDCLSLQNGVKIPCIGYGTWQKGGRKPAVCICAECLRNGEM